MPVHLASRRAAIIAMRQDGKQLAEIAEHYGISKQRVYQILHFRPAVPKPQARRSMPRRRAIISMQRLTRRETEIALLIQDGLHNYEIAQRLGLTVGTVKIHTHNIYAKQP